MIDSHYPFPSPHIRYTRNPRCDILKRITIINATARHLRWICSVFNIANVIVLLETAASLTL